MSLVIHRGSQMSLVDDFRDAGRSLRKQPRFLTIASLTLALGIGAVTAIFSVVNGVLLEPLPYPHANRLVNVWSTAPGLNFDQFPLSPDLFLFYRRNNQVFEDMALFQNRRVSITESGPPEVVDAAETTYSYFATLGAGFSRGRVVQRRRRQTRSGTSGRSQPAAVDAALRRGPADRRPAHSRQRRADTGGRSGAGMDGRSGIARRLAARPLQRGVTSDRQFRLERDRPSEGGRAPGSGGDAPRTAGAAGDERVHPERELSRVSHRRPLPPPGAPDEGGRDRQRARAAVDPARHGRHGPAGRVRQRRQPLPDSRGGATAGDRGARRAWRQPRRADAEDARGSSGALGNRRGARRAVLGGGPAHPAATRAGHDPAPRSRSRRRHGPVLCGGGVDRLGAHLRARARHPLHAPEHPGLPAPRRTQRHRSSGPSTRPASARHRTDRDGAGAARRLRAARAQLCEADAVGSGIHRRERADLPRRAARADISQGRRSRARHQSAGRPPRRAAIDGSRRRDHRPADVGRPRGHRVRVRRTSH